MLGQGLCGRVLGLLEPKTTDFLSSGSGGFKSEINESTC